MNLLLFLLGLFVTAPLETPHPAPINHFDLRANEQAVLDAERTRFAAMVAKDFAILDHVIHEDLYYIHSNGSVDTKQSFINALKDGKRFYDDITIDESQVRTYGKVGIINAKCTYHRTSRKGQKNNLRLHYTSVYAKEKGRWQHVSWQSFKITD